MNGRYDELAREMNDLLVKLATLVREQSDRVTQAQQAHQLAGSRRILTNAG